MSSAQILVVEDEAIVAKNIQMELTNMGYAVPTVAASGEEALQKAAETHPDLVLMDISLRGAMDGVETTERLRARFDLPVIYLTAHADEHTLQRAKKTGPFGYLLKPYEEKELRTTIEIALHKHRLEGARREMQQWLASTLRSIGDAVLVADARGQITILNGAAQALTGWSQEEALGKELLEVFSLIDPKTHTFMASPATRALRDGKVCSFEVGSLLVTKDGKETPVAGTMAPVYDERGSFGGFVAVFREFRSSKEVQEALDPSIEQERDCQERKAPSRSAGETAHEFNHLLTVVLGNISVALARLSQEDPNRELLANAEKATRDAARLVQLLLASPARQP